MNRVYTLTQVAGQLQIKESWLRARCEGREIPFTMLGGSYRFTEEHIEAIVRQYEQKPAPRRAPYRPQAPASITRLEPKVPPRLRKKQQTA
ncbi:helix-turn-helix domain-containing protein [Nocardiopsis dassonvillei]|uniref:helix-turn-helix domain-containing protein n=1 Tax=Nocardiopsis dassonvillei TaxID=2014 RepID=UPI00157D6D96|nr:helix-turn-helix domain-containing protein [Nocardiopsis dassonvillei]